MLDAVHRDEETEGGGSSGWDTWNRINGVGGLAWSSLPDVEVEVDWDWDWEAGSVGGRAGFVGGGGIGALVRGNRANGSANIRN